MLKNILYVCVVMLAMTNVGYAWDVKKNTLNATGWGYDGSFTRSNDSVDNFVRGGCTGTWKGDCQGSYGDEGAVLGVVAKIVVEHGGYFCPYQIQCANCRKCHRPWTRYLHPDGFSENKCAWLCEDGWTGSNCATRTSNNSFADDTDIGVRFSGVGMQVTGGDTIADDKNQMAVHFRDKDNVSEDVVIGVTQFLNNGVIAKPIVIECNRHNWKHNDSDVADIATVVGKAKILCPNGFMVDAEKSGCIPFNAEQKTLMSYNWCNGFPMDGYDSSIHQVNDSGSCMKYSCKEAGTGFANPGDTSCVKCTRGAAHSETGICVSCQLGQVFNQRENRCVPAVAYTKSDLKYGRGQTRNTNNNVATQCWTFVQNDVYKYCVQNGGQKTENEIEKLLPAVK